MTSEVTSPDAQGLVDTTKRFLQELGIDILKLRGQGYDGASVMCDAYGGVQQLIKNMCPSLPVLFVHYASHNLNLVINDAVKRIPQNEKFSQFCKMSLIFLGGPLIGGENFKLRVRKITLP